MKPWGITSSIILLWVAGIIIFFSAFSVPISQEDVDEDADFFDLTVSPENAILFLFVLGVMLPINSLGLWHQDSIAWWISSFFAIAIPATSVCLSVGIYAITATTIFGILLLCGLTHRDTVKAVKLKIKWKGWVFEE